jgi:hypothetical protein
VKRSSGMLFGVKRLHAGCWYAHDARSWRSVLARKPSW